MKASTCPVYVLAGGKGQRFGGDKGLVTIDGVPVIQRLSAELSALGHDVYVVSDHSQRYSSLSIECLVDVKPDCGPLAGLATAMHHRVEAHGAGWLLLVSCDQIAWRKEWFSELAQELYPDTQAAVFSESAQKELPQPIPGLYHSDLLGAAREQLNGNQLSLQKLLSVARPTHGTAQVNPRSLSFNTQEELEELLDRLDPHAS